MNRDKDGKPIIYKRGKQTVLQLDTCKIIFRYKPGYAAARHLERNELSLNTKNKRSLKHRDPILYKLIATLRVQ